MADSGQMRDRIARLTDRVEELEKNNERLRTINESFRGYMHEIAIDYHANAPEAYLAFSTGKLASEFNDTRQLILKGL